MWRQPANLCARREEADLVKAAEILAGSVAVAVDSALRLEALRAVGIEPVAPHMPSFDRDAWSLLHTLLVEERRLMEFLIGPRTNVSGAHMQKDDICVTCFATSIDDIWRLPSHIEEAFRGRSTRINKRLAHFAWVLATDDPRTTAGTWQTGYLRDVTQQLQSFCEWMAPIRPEAATALQHQLSGALKRAAYLPSPGSPWS